MVPGGPAEHHCGERHAETIGRLVESTVVGGRDPHVAGVAVVAQIDACTVDQTADRPGGGHVAVDLDGVECVGHRRIERHRARGPTPAVLTVGLEPVGAGAHEPVEHLGSVHADRTDLTAEGAFVARCLPRRIRKHDLTEEFGQDDLGPDGRDRGVFEDGGAGLEPVGWSQRVVVEEGDHGAAPWRHRGSPHRRSPGCAANGQSWLRWRRPGMRRARRMTRCPPQ